jgi:hypothetical protein
VGGWGIRGIVAQGKFERYVQFMEWLKQNLPVVMFLSGSMAAFILGQIVNFLSRKKSTFGYQIDSRNIVSVTTADLVVSYRNLPVQKMDSVTVSFWNLGNQPLINFPVRVQTEGGGIIVDLNLRPPEGSLTKVEPIHEYENVITFDLLKPGEEAVLDLTILNSTHGKVKIYARVANVDVKEISSTANSTDFAMEILDASPTLSFSRFLVKALARYFS